MWFTIASIIGCSVNEAQQRVDSREFCEWVVYLRNHPLVGDRVDLNGALVASTLVNINRDTKKKPKPYSIQDFLLKYRKEPKKVSDPSVIRNKVSTFLEMIGAKKKDN